MHSFASGRLPLRKPGWLAFAEWSLYCTKRFVAATAATWRIDALHRHTAHRGAVGLALTAAFLIVCLNAAAGLIGIEDDDPANLLYAGVLAIGFTGAIIARLRPRGLAHASFAMALALAMVGTVALRLPNTASPAQIVLLHGMLVAMFAGAALLFRHAARATTFQRPRRPGGRSG
jgi:hypothetical protein